MPSHFFMGFAYLVTLPRNQILHKINTDITFTCRYYRQPDSLWYQVPTRIKMCDHKQHKIYNLKICRDNQSTSFIITTTYIQISNQFVTLIQTETLYFSLLSTLPLARLYRTFLKSNTSNSNISNFEHSLVLNRIALQ